MIQIGRSYSRKRLFRMVIPRYPGFNIYSHIAKKTSSLGPVCVATAAARLPGWEVEVIDENNYRFPGPLDAQGLPDHAALQELRPADAVGFYGGLSCTVPRLFQVARFYQQAGAFTLAGGYHVAELPEEALRNGVDAVALGEGEELIGELLAARAAGRPLEGIAGVAWRKDGEVVRGAPRPPLEDFELLPLPDFGLLRFARMSVYPVGRIRGCGMNCEFCAVKGRARCASPERLLAQISWQVESRGAREFFVVDDQFAQDREETLRFCRLLKDYSARMALRLFLTVQIRLDCARDDELLTAMRGCGIGCLAVGIESPIQEELQAMGKHLKVAEMEDLAQTYHHKGFLVHGMFIFGYPMRPGVEFTMSAAERVQRFRNFIRRSKLDTVQVLLPVPLPGTTFRERLEAENRVFPQGEIGWEYYDGNFPLLVPDAPLGVEDLQKSILSIMGRFYRSWRLTGVMIHTLRFPLAMLPLIDLRGRFRRWYRAWRNDVIGSGGYFIMKGWKKQVAKGPFNGKLARIQQQLSRRRAPASPAEVR